MTIDTCFPCLPHGACKELKTRLVSTTELLGPDYVRDLRNEAASFGLTPEGWYLALDRALAVYPGRFVSGSGIEVYLTMRAFDKIAYRYWLREFTAPVPPQVVPHVRKEARGRVIIFASILKAYFPVRAALWGLRPTDIDTQSKATASVWPHALSCPLHQHPLIAVRVRDQIFARRR